MERHLDSSDLGYRYIVARCELDSKIFWTSLRAQHNKDERKATKRNKRDQQTLRASLTAICDLLGMPIVQLVARNLYRR